MKSQIENIIRNKPAEQIINMNIKNKNSNKITIKINGNVTDDLNTIKNSFNESFISLSIQNARKPTSNNISSQTNHTYSFHQ